MENRIYLVCAIALLCISIISNLMMYYKCNPTNEEHTQIIPNEIDKYCITVYYNKYKKNISEMNAIIKPYVLQLNRNSNDNYVVVLGQYPSNKDYEQISKLSFNYSF